MLESPFDRQQRQMDLFGRLFVAVFVVVLLAILTVWGVIGYNIYRVAADPVSASQSIGKAVGGFLKGVDEGQK